MVPGSTDRDRGYWRDVGTMASYYAAHMDVVSPLPVFNLYNFDWPIYTVLRPAAAGQARPGRGRAAAVGRRGAALAGRRGHRRHGAAGRCSRRRSGSSSGAIVSDSVLMNGVHVGAGAVVRNAILDKYVVVPPGARDRRRPGRADRARGFMVEDGLTILGKGQSVEG